jgi:hypothetical protein
MKCIRILNNETQELRNITIDTILKVDENAAERLIRDGHAQYVPKHEFKEQERKLTEKEK